MLKKIVFLKALSYGILDTNIDHSLRKYIEHGTINKPAKDARARGRGTKVTQEEPIGKKSRKREGERKRDSYPRVASHPREVQ